MTLLCNDMVIKENELYFTQPAIQCIMEMKWSVCILLSLIVNSVYSSLTTKYYEDLILQKITEAEDFKLPESNGEFKNGVESQVITDFGSYDFIIVGAGSAGSVVATRLSEIRDWNILLLEAGDDENDYSLIPNLFFLLQFSEKNWGYLTTPQKNACLGMKGKKCMAPRGKSIGGTGAINGAFYVRGNPKDYDKWVELGNPGWSYEQVLPYFMKSENSQTDGDNGYHGTGGFWNVEHILPYPDHFETIVDANAELNQSYIDYNGKKQIGVSKPQWLIKHGKRQGTGTAFLDNARKRSNLKIVKKALVTKINIDPKTQTVLGVEFVTDNSKFKTVARKEVLVCAGVVNTPQLLMLSGIGPKEHLEELGINVIADLPVGKNLADHPLFPGLVIHTNYTHKNEHIRTLIEKYVQGYGPLTNPAYISGTGFLSQKDNPDKNVPMVQYLFIPPNDGSLAPTIESKIYNFNDELNLQFLSKLNARTDFVFLLLLLHPKSRGRITLKSSNPLNFPNIDLNMFSEPEDVDHLIDGIEFILELAKTDVFQQLNATIIDIPICSEHKKYSRDFWRCVVRQMTMSGYHLTGTTSMGPDKISSVVDYNLKVHGISKVRVIDAGVIPTTMSGPTFTPTVMLAEKISDVIKDTYKNEKEQELR